MKQVLSFFLIGLSTSLLLISCGNKLTEKKALALVKEQVPIDTTWRFFSLETTTWNNYKDYEEAGVLKKIPPTQYEESDGRNRYELTDEGKKYLNNIDSENPALIWVKSHFTLDYHITDLKEEKNSATATLVVEYGISPFFKKRRQSETGVMSVFDEKLNRSYGIFNGPEIKCYFSKSEGKWSLPYSVSDNISGVTGSK